jgi:hypothetical protein
LSLARETQTTFNPREGHAWRIAAAAEGSDDDEDEEEEVDDEEQHTTNPSPS